MSILEQSHRNLFIYIFDDCSRNKLDLDALNLDFKNKVRLIRRDSNIGYAKNFINGLAESDATYDYYAYSDQDDIWNLNKIERAINILENQEKNSNLLYCSTTKIFDDKFKKIIGNSIIFNKAKCFKNALVQNIAGGNTMVFNKKSRDLIVNSLKNSELISHDWATYQIVSGSGGKIIYDLKPSLKYRQHKGNLAGSNKYRISAAFIRIKAIFNKSFKEWNTINIKYLFKNKNILTIKNKDYLNYFIEARESSNILLRFFYYYKSGVYRQNLGGNIALIIALIFKKL